MPKFELQLKAQLHNVASFSVEDEDYPWFISLLCGSCGESSTKPVVISRSDEASGIRGASVSIRIACKLCKRTNDITLLPGPSTYTAETSPAWAPFLTLEARGTEPTRIDLSDDAPLRIAGATGFVVDESESFIADTEFYGYDEKAKTDMSITEFEARVIKI